MKIEPPHYKKKSNKICSPIISRNYEIFLSLFISWAAFHFVRKSFFAIIPSLKTELYASVDQIGFLSTTFYASYSVSKLFSGYIADSINVKYIISIGLILSGVTNIMFGCLDSIAAMSCCLVISSLAQAISWPAIAKLLIYLCESNERGKWWGLCGMGQNIGAGIIPVFAGLVCVYLNWRWAMYLSGFFNIIIGTVMFAVLNNLLNRSKKHASLSSDLFLDKSTFIIKHKKSFFSILTTHIFSNKAYLTFAFSGFFLYVVRSALNDWVPLYLIEEKNYATLLEANLIVSWFEIGGALGSIIICWVSDVIFQSNRLKANILFSALLFFVALLFFKNPAGYAIIDGFCMTLIGFLVFGLQGIFGLTTTEMVERSYGGTANSIGSAICNFGAAISGYPIAVIIGLFSWKGFFVCVLVCCIFVPSLSFLSQFSFEKGKNRCKNSS